MKYRCPICNGALGHERVDDGIIISKITEDGNNLEIKELVNKSNGYDLVFCWDHKLSHIIPNPLKDKVLDLIWNKNGSWIEFGRKENKLPYIEREKRDKFDMSLQYLGKHIEKAGDLDYCITKLCTYFIQTMGGLKFKNLALVAGILLFVILETYRRIASPYEDEKKNENGDVYTQLGEF